jgi:hypothetical protein
VLSVFRRLCLVRRWHPLDRIGAPTLPPKSNGDLATSLGDTDRLAQLTLTGNPVTGTRKKKKIKKEKNLEVESCLVVATFTSSKVIESVANFFSARRANFQLL